jgi:hypothetical protein
MRLTGKNDTNTNTHSTVIPVATLKAGDQPVIPGQKFRLSILDY